MAFAKPKHSKGEINRAGDVLICPSSTDEEINNALEILNQWRACHAYPINTFQATLRARLKKTNTNSLVAQRLKRTPSVVRKLQLSNRMALSRMQDIGGLRAVLDTITDVNTLKDEYTQKNKLEHELIKTNDYIINPKDSGYRSLHLIFKYKNSRNPIYDGLLVELQIRTKLQHAWATAVETIGTYLDKPLKSSQGPQSWLDFFKIVSAAFSIIENTPINSELSHLSNEEILELATNKATDLNVIKTLLSFTIATDSIETKNASGNYHIIKLNSENMKVEVTSFGQRRLAEATEAYLKIEQNIASSPHLQVVLVATESIDSLKKAYPSYFLNTEEFCKAIITIYKMLNQINAAKLSALKRQLRMKKRKK
ncbi:RelA/SpoT domain-containing protein [Chromobacterium piscinae]|uniref:RelA/SpoT domain-containing protein n=1 Tax=Chromobacterium piscinae TaxID=686831 RepID=UPI001E605A74|nr:RelA/SpoT domain-containing protein [Chromobacterium piscinae]MCD4505505.1 RelA/SpoT domain-containing protein [Chromobacterium piscinae]